MTKYKVNYHMDGVDFNHIIDFEGNADQLNKKVCDSLNGGIITFYKEKQLISLMVSSLMYYSIEEVK